MASLNKVMLIGNLTRDPELRYTPKGTAVTKLGMAVNRVWTTESGEKKEEVTFVDVDVFGRSAENAGKYLQKGRSLFVEGRLRLDTWEDKQTNQKRSKLCVTAERIQFLGSPRGGGGEQESQEEGGELRGRGAAPAMSPPPPPPEPVVEPRGDDENLPF